MFHLHPSKTLRELFREKPYQGAPPESATFIFVGLDANFDETVETKPIFTEITDYLHDGVDYWQSRGFHHPFLHPSYKGCGRPYHKRFAAIGLRPVYASAISFVELLDVPTFGRSDLQLHELNDEHLRRLERWLFGGGAKQVLMFDKTRRLLSRIPYFRSRLASAPIETVGDFPLHVFYRDSKTTVYATTHFSYWGARYTTADRERQAADIRNLIERERQ